MIFPGLVNAAPKLVAAPLVVAVELDSPDLVSAPGYLFNMGGEELHWSVSESASWLELWPTSGSLPSGTYQGLTYTFDATDLMDGVYTAVVTVDSDDPVNPVFTLEARLELFTDISAVLEDQPRSLALLGPVPNPFNPTTLVRFTLPASQHIVLGIYDVRGRLVQTLVDGIQTAGLHRIRWNGHDASGRAVSSGTYFARLQAADQTRVKSLTLVR